jgi:hypothetical protein
MKSYKEIKLKSGLTVRDDIVWKGACAAAPTDGGHMRKSNVVNIRTPKTKPQAA